MRQTQKIPPRVAASILLAHQHGWCTNNRFGKYTKCRICQAVYSADSLDHLCQCVRLRMVARKHFELGPHNKAQFLLLQNEAEDARMKSLVSETAIADQERREVDQQVESMNRHHQHLIAEIKNLEERQDQLLEKISKASAGRGL